MIKLALLPFLFIITSTLFCILLIPISFVVLPLSQPKRLAITGPFWAMFSNILLKYICLSKVYKEDHRPQDIQKQNNPAGLYIGNHRSYMDIPLILAQFQLSTIMKKEVLYIPVFGVCAYAAGGLILNRMNRASRRNVLIKAMKQLDQDGLGLQYFPEATRQRSKPPKPLGKIKSSLIQYAFDMNIPVYAFSIYGTEAILNKNGTLNIGKKIGIIVHDGEKPSEFEDKEAFIKKCWENVTDGYDQLEGKLN